MPIETVAEGWVNTQPWPTWGKWTTDQTGSGPFQSREAPLWKFWKSGVRKEFRFHADDCKCSWHNEVVEADETEEEQKARLAAEAEAFKWKYHEEKIRRDLASVNRTPAQIEEYLEFDRVVRNLPPRDQSLFVGAWTFGEDAYPSVDVSYQQEGKRQGEKMEKFMAAHGVKKLPGLEPREYIFGPLGAQEPIPTGAVVRVPPLSGLFVPRHLSSVEDMAVRIAGLLDGVSLNKTLAKKLKAQDKGSYRVYFKNGKMKPVKASSKA